MHSFAMCFVNSVTVINDALCSNISICEFPLTANTHIFGKIRTKNAFTH